ncbi:MAG: hypothetical protein Q9160_000525 [Pyrenula sp. 1 TL-2023]
MIRSQLLTFILLISSAAAVPFWKRSPDFDFGNQKVRGVNIGGWLVLEPWITPSIFQQQDQSKGIVDEYSLCKQNSAAGDILLNHWNTWLTYQDLQKIASGGFNMVRIPIGYWAFKKLDNDPYVTGAQDQLDKAIDWAGSLGLKVMVDLHGAPLSQNAYDNSGQKLGVPGWGTQDSISHTMDVLAMMADKYAQPSYQKTVVAIELLNEPLMEKLPGGKDATAQYFKDGYNRVRQVSDTNVIFHDGFAPASQWNGFLSTTDNNAQKVVIDHHEYQVFNNDQVAMLPWQHRQAVCNGASSYASNRDKWLIVGEWTAAMTDCAPALNGYNVGARYDGTYTDSKFVGSCDGKSWINTWDDTFKNDMRGYIEAQLDVFERQTNGWIFWNFKTESAAEWDLFRLMDAGVFPQPISDRKFSTICS